MNSGPVLEKAGLGAQLGPQLHTPAPSRGSHNLFHETPNRLLRARHRQHLTLACTRVPPKRCRTNTPSDQPQTISEQETISFTNSVSKGRSWQAQNPAEVNCALCGQNLHSSSYAVVGVVPHSYIA
uniref:Uncharacterized protein n=1 Tax=Molossus molossus TaxID=27622 RepID=A0A7J8FS77_MOLMO|nr:hypothetical protein HJG59_008325 [Molossus molossus]